MTTPIVPSITDEELAELEESVVSALADPDLSDKDVATVMAIGGIIARLRAAEKDAARYRFIRSEDTKPGFLSSDPERAFFIDEYLVCESVMDARIDTAMEQSK